MPVRLSREQFVRNLSDSGIFSDTDLHAMLRTSDAAPDGEALARHLVRTGKLTPYQATAVQEGRVGELLIGNYLVLDKLGAGGMGTVYKAQHRRMKRIVAIKVLSRNVAQSEKFVQRFQREVEAVARLSHPNVVMAHDADEAEVGHFLVMEFVNGRDLATIVQEGGPLPLPDAIDCTLQAARALQYAHEQGIIHRDVKPANLLRDVSGVVKLADLGLARFSDAMGKSPDEAAALTQAGAIMGTVDYMPPEQALGLTTIDHRADIYSLGCTLWYLVVGKPPYQGSSLMAILLQHREGKVPSLREQRKEIPPALDDLFRRMVAKKPEDRFASMAEVVRILEGLRNASVGATAPTPGPSATASPPPAPTSLSAGTVDISNQTVDLAPVAVAETTSTTVLLAEPSRSQAVIIRGYLQKLGNQMLAMASTGQAAFESALEKRPGVIISAMHLPDMTGVQLAQKLRAEPTLSTTGFVLIASATDGNEADLLSTVPHAIRLPKPFDAEKLAGALRAAAGSHSSSPAAWDGMRVLLVDDSAAARIHVRKVLEGLGLRQITEVADGAEAVALLECGIYDLVVTDYTMPRLDGRGLIDFIRHRSAVPNLPVIMVTTETDAAKLDAVRQLGVLAICDKKFESAHVRAALERLR